ncbi:DUF4197 domain-containing protein [Candidatus Marinarcus aquaticus]|uniref:DUF4197 domain-containing protein n=1 Tax=Candidatus Marinarcus aquaticus TaxID=2044504 RepID=A0A4Q0XTL8_9BACT|nr:DUF4197 domain-containing protein [Candidatus Marinarcus aquaticus]RXJ60766.1 hypothetical protein CRV04_01765 [Candidatus Marinarcus aquaticus]
MKAHRILLSTLILASAVFASWQDMAKGVIDSLGSSKSSTTTSNSTQDDSMVSKALKAALDQGVNSATAQLSKEKGFLNSSVKIPLPSALQTLENTIRKAGGGQYADELIHSMNSAASKSVPKTVDIFKTAITNMSIEDATTILNGSNTATTDYFQSKTQSSLTKAIAPIVQESMKSSQVATYYKAFNDFYQTQGKELVKNSSIQGFAKSFGVDSYLPGNSQESLEEYITAKTIEGLFSYIAKEESAIRTNPQKRTTELLKEVFGK